MRLHYYFFLRENNVSGHRATLAKSIGMIHASAVRTMKAAPLIAESQPKIFQTGFAVPIPVRCYSALLYGKQSEYANSIEPGKCTSDKGGDIHQPGVERDS